MNFYDKPCTYKESTDSELTNSRHKELRVSVFTSSSYKELQKL